MAQLPIETQWRDALGNTGRVSLHVRDLTTVAEILSAAQSIVSAVNPVCTAVNFQASSTFRLAEYQPETAGEASNIFERAFFVFRNGDNRGVLSVPSPASLLFDVAGPYRVIRITRDRLGVLGLRANLEAAMARFIVPGGGAFPSTFVVGGRQGLAL
jgi:hypothetical protein